VFLGFFLKKTSKTKQGLVVVGVVTADQYPHEERKDGFHT